MNPVLIVGGGIAGISLAHALLDRGIDFRLVDDGKNACSSVAAGIVNPFSFRRTLLTWNANPFFAEALDFYQSVAEKLETTFHTPIEIRRVFTAPEEPITWEQRRIDPLFSPFMLPSVSSDTAWGPYGSGRIHGFWVKAACFVRKNHRFFESQGLLLRKSFDTKDFNETELMYQKETYSKVVFALGYRNKELPWFKEVPVQSTQGEVLTVRWQNKDERTSIHRKIYALPIGQQHFKVGATHKWDTESLVPSEEAKKELMAKFEIITSDIVEVIDHEVGVRPTSPDRRPFIGQHAEIEGLFIFNGLGTKGYLTAPPLAKSWVEYLLTQVPLEKCVDPYRFLGT